LRIRERERLGFLFTDRRMYRGMRVAPHRYRATLCHPSRLVLVVQEGGQGPGTSLPPPGPEGPGRGGGEPPATHLWRRYHSRCSRADCFRRGSSQSIGSRRVRGIGPRAHSHALSRNLFQTSSKQTHLLATARRWKLGQASLFFLFLFRYPLPHSPRRLGHPPLDLLRRTPTCGSVIMPLRAWPGAPPPGRPFVLCKGGGRPLLWAKC